ncbi:hypothetical protein [Anabaena subtropica]|uniref:Uncharacterized protein n=1 Tax=Anabaena subtropica FACHB-260 TaxID=2692884 RepID=A0ABR8CTH2_9NOST|nr:hypothetical protein [Anabaena subtropica]MBD2346491.1 hypothetical protein [Anabaena subtropica FACHB-260]
MKEQNPLFTELSSQESAVVSGGRRVSFDLDTYLYILGAAVLFGNPGLTSEEIHFAWTQSFIFYDDTLSDNDSSIGSGITRRSSRRSTNFGF